MSKSILVDNVTGVILAGGKSSRMGINKSFLKIDDITLIERCYQLMKSVFTKVVISTNDPDQFDFINSEKVKDIYGDFGPLSGIYSALNF